MYYIKGTFTWDRATGKITSKSNGNFDITYCNFGASWVGHYANMSVYSYLTNSSTVANFKGSFDLYVNYQGGDFLYMGNLSGYVTGSPSY